MQQVCNGVKTHWPSSRALSSKIGFGVSITRSCAGGSDLTPIALSVASADPPSTMTFHRGLPCTDPRLWPCTSVDQAAAPRPSVPRSKRQRIVRCASKSPEVTREQPAEVQASATSLPTSLTEQILSSNTVEGDPLKALRLCEAYWTVRTALTTRVF